MSGQDDDLLRRLNALKPSQVNLDSKSTTPSVDVGTSNPLSVEDKLAQRLKGLRSGSGSGSQQSHAESVDALTAQVKDEVATENDPIKDWQTNDNDDKTIENILAELGPDDQWKLDPDDPQNIAALLKEANDALPPPQSEGADQDQNSALETADDPEASEENQNNKTEDQQDNEDAEDYVKRVLAELEVEKKYGGGDDDENDEDGDGDEKKSTSAFKLPSTPSNLPQSADSSEPPSYEDSELEARFSKLGLALPSTPSSAPSTKAKAQHKANIAALNKSKAKSNLPKYTDEDIDSWCCICNEDGEVKCLDCDGDLYCNNCWNEGHGTGPGQERGHRAVQYNRRGPAAAA